MSFVKKCGADSTEVSGFCNNALNVRGHEQMQSQAVIDAAVIESNKKSETAKIKTVSAVMSLLSGRKYKLIQDDEYGLCLKYGHIVLYTAVKRAHIRVNGGVINSKDGLQYDNNEGGLLSTELSLDEVRFLSEIEGVIHSQASYVYVNDAGHISSYCSDVNEQKVEETSGEIQSPAWEMPA